jgi:protoheme IX farnesyltransferase
MLTRAQPTARGTVQGRRVRPGDYVALTKPGIVLWLVITAYVAMVVAERGLPGVPTTVVTLGGLALSAGGAHAVNMWFDRDIDAVMARTQHRPVASGRIMPRAALVFGIVLGMISLGGMLRWGNAPSALATAAGYLYYVLVYTIWLKRRSPQNIVIGGVAGAVPPLVGWLAVSPHWAWPPVWMFVIITLWTPPHFWALAIARADDYRRAGVPMLPVVRGTRRTIQSSMWYTVLLWAASIGLGTTGAVGPVYVWTAVVLGAAFLGLQVAQWRRLAEPVPWARRTFLFSLAYIAILFVAMPMGPHG